MGLHKKVKIITTVAAWPEALEVQRILLDKFLQEPYELIAYVDTPATPCQFNLWDKTLRAKAIHVAHKYCDRVYAVPDIIHSNRKMLFPKTKEPKAVNANLRAADTLQYAWESEISENLSPVLILDNDMFPIADFSISEQLENNHISGILNTSFNRSRRKQVQWLWSGLLFMNPHEMNNKNLWSFDCGRVNGVHVDVSGQTYHWINEGGNRSKLVQIQHLPSLTWNESMSTSIVDETLLEILRSDDRNRGGYFYSELYDEKFLHYRAGSNWNGESPEKVIQRNLKFSQALIGLK